MRAHSATLVEVGPAGSGADHAADPTTVQDVFVRIGGVYAAVIRRPLRAVTRLPPSPFQAP